MICPVLQTGQTGCFDGQGLETPCPGSGQDGELRVGLPWPAPRFRSDGFLVTDLLTGLTWTASADHAGYPMTWGEALAHVRGMNRDRTHGYGDWRLPNRRELRSLLSYQTRRPALPAGHPFSGVFLGWYWTSTSAAVDPRYAWYVHLDGARMFYGRKDQDCLVWPVRGASSVLPATGQQASYDGNGRELIAPDPGQDGGGGTGLAWPEGRFVVAGEAVLDQLTGLEWLRRASLSAEVVSWDEAIDLVTALNGGGSGFAPPWRLPNINELESLVDCSRHAPALPANHPFQEVGPVYWSSTTSFFEPSWAWALYLDKGALGVGFKQGRHFHVWPVRGAPGRRG